LEEVAGYFNLSARLETVGLNVNYDSIVVPLVDPVDLAVGHE
jgi:hypothetical protein